MMSLRKGMQLVLLAGGALLGHADAGAAPNRSAVERLDTNIDQVLSRDLTTVKFAPRSSDLTDNEKARLTALVDKAKKDPNVDRFVVAAWADRNYPARGAKLSKPQRDLADRRIEHVTKILKDAGADTVDTYSFAEHPAWLAKVFNTDNAKIKGEGAKINNGKDRSVAILGRKVRAKGGPDTAVVIIRYKDGSVSH